VDAEHRALPLDLGTSYRPRRRFCWIKESDVHSRAHEDVVNHDDGRASRSRADIAGDLSGRPDLFDCVRVAGNEFRIVIHQQ
jgi:hypothetical protein